MQTICAARFANEPRNHVLPHARRPDYGRRRRVPLRAEALEVNTISDFRPLSPVSSAVASVGPCAAGEGIGDSFLLETFDALDLAQSKMDEAEKLFFSGHSDAALRAVRVARDVLDGIK